MLCERKKETVDEAEAWGSEGSMSDLPDMNVNVDLPAVGLRRLYAVAHGDLMSEREVLQVKVTLSDEMRIVYANDSFLAFLGHCEIYPSFTYCLESDHLNVSWFLISIAFDVTAGNLALPHVAEFGPILLCSTKSTLKYRAKLVVTFAASWTPEDSAVTFTLCPANAHRYILNEIEKYPQSRLKPRLKGWVIGKGTPSNPLQGEASLHDVGKGVPSCPVQSYIDVVSSHTSQREARTSAPSNQASCREPGKRARSANNHFAEELPHWPRNQRAACTKVSL